MKRNIKYSIIFSILTIILGLSFSLNKPATSQISDEKILHLVERISYGPVPGELNRVKVKGIESYIKEQLSPETIPESHSLTEKLREYKTLKLTPVELYQAYYPSTGKKAQELSEEAKKAELEKFRTVYQEAREIHLLKAIYSPKQLEEIMTDFWFNHFNVYLGKSRETRLWVGNYENEAIRPYVFGNFRDLLEATSKHPAMLYYLDNWRNTAPEKAKKRGNFQGLNENYARELMELHTLGVDGGYTQEDVITLARILTGWGVSLTNKGEFYFDESRHDFRDKVFLGQTIKGTGIQEVEEALDILAIHPSTAKFISYKLAQYFITDNPPESLVKKLTETFLKNKGNIRSVLLTLFQSSEFWDTKYYQQKFKNPAQYILSLVRATGAENVNIKRVQGMLQQLDMDIYGCVTPDGFKNTQSTWLNSDSILKRLSFATAIANGNLILGDRKPLNSEELINTFANQFSPETKEVLNNTPPRLKNAVILGAPEMMYR